MAEEEVDDAAPEPIPEAAWDELEPAIAHYAAALHQQWLDPSFRISSWERSGQLRYATTVADGATRLPVSQHAIRGATGVEVKVERVEPVVRAHAAIRSFRLLSLGGLGTDRTPAEEAVAAARAEIHAVVEKHPTLRRQMHQEIWMRLPQPRDPLWLERSSRETAIDSLMGDAFEKNGWTPENMTPELSEQDVKSVVAKLRGPIEDEREGYSIIAMLSGPAIDLPEPVNLLEGQWNGLPSILQIGYPSDQLCEEVLGEMYHGDSYPEPALRMINAFVRLVYGAKKEESFAVHSRARDFVRLVIDLLRLLTTDDVGLLHLHGKIITHRLAQLNPFMFVFQDDHELLARVPVRRVFDTPTLEDAIDDGRAERLAALFKTLAVDEVKVLGMPVAMERLRAVYERYAPDELGRLVDAVTALEALFLSDGAKDELKFRLQVRLARLLAGDLPQRRALADTFSKIYDLRSEIVHTGQPSKKLSGRAAELQREAVAILRRAILHFLESDFARGKGRKEMTEAWRTLMLS